MNTPYVAVLHHDDADGFGAAYACWKHLKADEVIYIPVQYGQPVPEIPEGVHRLFIVDFSYDRATCDDLARRYHLTVIDHHRTAAAALEDAPYAKFDMSKSGAVLTWNYFAPPGSDVPEILRYVQDYDLWKFELLNSKAINLFISALPNDFELWDALDMATAYIGGKAIELFRDAQIKRRMKDVVFKDFFGYYVPTLNASDNISELGNEMCKAYPDALFSLSYCDRVDFKRSYSLRSIGDFDVSEVVKKFGGGGHQNAAGFVSNAPALI